MATQFNKSAASGWTPIHPVMMVAGLVGLCGAVPAAGESRVIRLWPSAIVNTDVVQLGDLIDLKGFTASESKGIAGAVIGIDFQPGGRARFSLSEIRDALDELRVNMARVKVCGAAECEVTRPVVVMKSVKPSPQAKRLSDGPSDEIPSVAGSEPVEQAMPGTLEAQLREHIEMRSARLDGKLRVKFSQAAKDYLAFSEPEYAFQIHDVSPDLLGLLNFKADILRGGKVELRDFPVTAKVTLVTRVVVARRPINMGGKLASGDLAMEEREFDSEDKIGETDLKPLLGYQARSFIRRGYMVALRDLKQVPLVRRNQLVNVYARSGGIVTQVAAKALKEGIYGDSIEVKSMATGERFHVTIRGEGVAEVGGIPQVSSAGPSLRGEDL